MVTLCPDCKEPLKGNGARAISAHRRAGSCKRNRNEPRYRTPDSRTKAFKSRLLGRRLVDRKNDNSKAGRCFNHHSRTVSPIPEDLEGPNQDAKGFYQEDYQMEDLEPDRGPSHDAAEALADEHPMQVDGDLYHDALEELQPQRPVRRRYFPARFSQHGLLPSAQLSSLRTFTQGQHTPSPSPSPSTSPASSRSPSPAPSDFTEAPKAQTLRTKPNDFGLYRIYKRWPKSDPEDLVTLEDLADAPTFSREGNPRGFFEDTEQSTLTCPDTSYAPFPNGTIARLIGWFTKHFTNSQASLNLLVTDVMLHPDHNPADLEGFSAATELKRLNDHAEQAPDGWIQDSVSIPLPQPHRKHKSEDVAPTAEIPGVMHRSLLQVIISAAKDKSSETFHWRGFKQMWKPSPTEPSERVYGETYTSDAFLEMEEEVSAHKPVDCDIENIVVPLHIYSDGTVPSTFGSAHLWPFYAWIGLLSKYIRCKPSSFSAHHFAYIPKLPDWIQGSYKTIYNSVASDDTLTFLRRQLIHAIWSLILISKPEFIHAYMFGVVVLCYDGISRRLFPRFFVYSADYPEKVLLAGIKFLGKHLCPLCTCPKTKVHQLGTKLDQKRRQKIRVDSEDRQGLIERARRSIFEKGRAVAGDIIDRILGCLSLAPIRNAFSAAFCDLGFNFYQMFAPDVMHGFELGVWKQSFCHLVRMLYFLGHKQIQTLNERYRQVSTFGRGTIRRFSADVVSMKRLAARDFEDLLQCALPCFEELFPARHDPKIQNLLFMFATWHALAKLRMHTDSSLSVFEETITILGQQLRFFVNRICPEFQTFETPAEAAAKERRRIARDAKRAEQGLPPLPPRPQKRKPKEVSLETFKVHDMGHYPGYIRRYGTTDSYNTQTGELEHKMPKKFYARTNKNTGFEKQVTKNERRAALSREIQDRMAQTNQAPEKATRTQEELDDDNLPLANAAQPYQMSTSRNLRLNLTQWLADNKGDLSLENFLPDLQDHILGRLKETPNNEFSSEERRKLQIENNSIYSHKTLRINYMTYDVRREQDTINPRTQSDIMVLAGDSEEDDASDHPYWYARVIGIFHAKVRSLSGPREFRDIEFLWVRWYGFDCEANAGFKAKRLYQVGFLDAHSDAGAFGFIDPRDVIRAVHMIPRYVDEQTDMFLPPSIARREEEGDLDYFRYYVNMFVDRDMFMRFCGLGIGHVATRMAMHSLRDDFREAFGVLVELEEDDEGSDGVESDMENRWLDVDSEDDEEASEDEHAGGEGSEEDDSDDEDPESEDNFYGENDGEGEDEDPEDMYGAF